MSISNTLDRARSSIRPRAPTVAKNAPWGIYRAGYGDVIAWAGPYRVRRDAVRAAIGAAYPWSQPHKDAEKRLELAGWIVRRASWQQRESWRFRFDGRGYVPPVWSNETFWMNRGPAALVEHYAHAAKKDPGSIAFTESPEKGMRDVQTVIKAGRYLKRFFGDVLTAKQIAFYAEWQRAGSRPPSDLTKTLKLEFATTPDEIVAAYADGPGSCMKGYEAVQVYGAGDLAVACLVRPRPHAGEPRVLARALVWPAKKVVGRIYPNEGDATGFSSHAEAEDVRNGLLNRLLADGYRSTYSEGWDLFDGAKLLAIHLGSRDYVMPYIDGTSISFHGDHFTMQEDGELCAESTCGTLDFDDGNAECHSCGEYFDRDDSFTVYTLVTNDGIASGNETYCPSCADNEAFYCDANCVYVANDVAEPVEMVSGGHGLWNSAYLIARGGFVCAYDGLGRLSGESEVYPGFAAEHDDNSDAHPELQPELPLSASDAETPREAA